MNLKIALLATGDEIVEGDVINTASPAIAQILKPLGLPIAAQMACDDQQSNITKALRYLLDDHDIVITTGGLGPTCDDRTRYSLAEVCDEALILDAVSWDRVYSMIMKHRGFVPENNKQQSLFPKSAIIIENISGTADGCHVQMGNKHIFMLPGPPSQSIPMVENYIKPFLLDAGLAKPYFRKSWMLLNASESHLATQIDNVYNNEDNSVDIGYRFNPPYLQFKLKADDEHRLQYAEQTLAPILEQYIWRQGEQTAIDHLKAYLDQATQPVWIEDKLTQGHLNSLLLEQVHANKISFAPNTPLTNALQITVSSENNLYTATQEAEYLFDFNWQLVMMNDGKPQQHTITSKLSRYFAQTALTEWIAIELLKLLPVSKSN